MYQSFKSLLEFEGTEEEFEDLFPLTFQISLTDSFENTVSFNLKENGDQIAVKMQNRQVKNSNFIRNFIKKIFE